MSYEEIKKALDNLLEDIKEHGVWRAKWKKDKWMINAPKAVSYTHLTLPTILLV